MNQEKNMNVHERARKRQCEKQHQTCEEDKIILHATAY